MGVCAYIFFLYSADSGGELHTAVWTAVLIGWDLDQINEFVDLPMALLALFY